MSLAENIALHNSVRREPDSVMVIISFLFSFVNLLQSQHTCGLLMLKCTAPKALCGLAYRYASACTSHTIRHNLERAHHTATDL